MKGYTHVHNKPLLTYEPYNPLDKKNLGKSVAEALLESEVHSLPPEIRFVGAGVYAIYYTGDFNAYDSLVARNADGLRHPIYVGKAIPSGGRKGTMGTGNKKESPLWHRLEEHAKSIRTVVNLHIEDFRCQYLVVDDIFISLGERLLIEMFHPVWNRAIDGFGNHAPGRGRSNMERPRWDVLHPGRSWASTLSSTRTQDQIVQELSAFFDAGQEPDDVAEANEQEDI